MPITAVTTLSLTMRPRDFSEVIGLETAVKTLKTLLDSGAVPRAFLLKGPYGCGKTTLSHIIAKYIQGPLFEGQADVQELNAANYRKIEDMRTLCQGCGSYPMLGTYKVIILDECHQLTKDSKEVLLKELEVPKSPTVWILCTTDPQKLNEGIRSRCTVIDVEGMAGGARHALLVRAAEALGRVEPFDEFEAEITKNKVTSPRKILQSFQLYHSGTPAAKAVGTQAVENLPEYNDIGFAVCFGKWDSATSMFGGTLEVKALGQLLKELDERLKKKPAPDSETAEKEDAIESDDLDSKTEVATALRAVVGAFLKGQILPSIQKNGTFKYKQQVQRDKAQKAMQALAGMIPSTAFELQWSGIIATLYRVNQIMQGGN